MLLLFLLSQGIILLIIAFLLILLSFVWPPDSPWSPWWTTSLEVSRVICDLAKITNKDTLFELGSGNGTTLMVAAKEYHAHCVGVEIDPIRYWFSRFTMWRMKLQDKVTIYRKNFFAVDISSASVVYMYLVPKAVKKLQNKFLAELKPGTKVLSYRYKVPYLEQIGHDKDHEIFVYVIPEKKK